jgi:hypothetical protein
MKARGTKMNWKVIGLGAVLLVAVTAVAQAELPPVADLDVTGRPLYMKLQWSPVDTASPGELDYYKVYRSETQGDAGDSIGTTTDAAYFDQDCAYHVFYWYEVHPVDTMGVETMTGNNQAGDSLMTLGDPGVEITSHVACSVVEDEDAAMAGTWAYAIGVDVNGHDAWMSLDPDFESGEWNVTVPLVMGTNDMLATATGTEGRSATDNVRIARIPVGSGDPTLAFTSHTDGEFVVGPGPETLEGEVANGACVMINGGDYLDLTWAPAYDLATWAEDVTLAWGENVFEAHAMGSMNREVSDTLTLYAVPEGPVDVEITSPEDMFVTEDEMITVDGTCFAVGWVELNGEEVTITFDGSGNGTWSYEDLALELGPNTLCAVGFGFAATDTATITVYRVETTPPAVEITSPEDNLITTDSTVDVVGTSENCGYIMLNGYTIEPDAAGAWDYAGFPLVEGENAIVAVGYGADGQTATDEVTVFYYPPGFPPEIAITYPEDGEIIVEDTITVTGTSQYCAYIMVDGEMAVPEADGSWEAAYAFSGDAGEYTITAVGYGTEDQTATDEVTVYYLPTVEPPAVEITFPPDEYITTQIALDVTGTSENCAYVMIGDETAVPDANGGWEIPGVPIDPGMNTVTVTGYGSNDQTATDEVTVFWVGGTPPTVEITYPPDEHVTANTTIDVDGTSQYCAYLMINDERVYPEANGDWSYADYTLDMGTNTIEVVGYGAEGLTADDQVTVTRVVAEEFEPHKIFTPNGDNYNDCANFEVETGEVVKIYTLDGQLVVELDSPTMGPNGYVMRWNGCDEEGEHAPAGLYIYEITGGDETKTGTVGLAR